MAYDNKLADRIRERLANLPNVEEKPMMGGLTFMYNGKMCVGIIKGDLMCRVDPELHNELIQKQGCRTMDFTQRPMSGYIMIDDSGMTTDAEFNYWIDQALGYNPQAKASKKKKAK